jgi:MYXO-CTERM domain-containing protein
LTSYGRLKRKEDLKVKQIGSLKFFRVLALAMGLTLLPLAMPTYAQTGEDNRNANTRRDDRDADRDRRDRRDDDDDADFPWGVLGLVGLAGLLGLRRPKRDIYVDDRDMPPPRR